MLTYEEAVAALSAMQERAGRTELDRMREFARRLGVADGGTPRFVHVAGTNGKGSTTAMAQSLGIAQGFRTGGYFSPYVFDLRERVQMNGALIPREDFARHMSQILPVAEAMRGLDFGGPTEFEAKTALGFLHWQAERAEVVALEVGLGGRLDSTNIVDPAVSIITSISLDHQKILGDTIAKIAREKAGIIKPGRPVVMGEVPAAAARVIERRARDLGCEIWRYGQEVRTRGDHNDFSICTPRGEYEGLSLHLYGDKQVHNAALAVAAFEMAGLIRDRDKVAEGLRRASLPGRFQAVTVEGRTVILDGAHNAESAAVLSANIQHRFRDQVVLLTGMLQGHDPAPFYRAVRGGVGNAHVVPISFRKGMSPEALFPFVRACIRDVSTHETLDEAITEIWNMDDRRPVLVTGSFYLLSDFRDAVRRLKLSFDD